jgi:hypothetical protein
MSKGLYSRNKRKLAGIEDINAIAGRTITLADDKGYVDFTGSYSNRILLDYFDERSAATAVTYTAPLDSYKCTVLDPSTVHTEQYHAMFRLDKNLPLRSVVDVTVLCSIDETTNSVTAWSTPKVAALNEINEPTATKETGFYYKCTVGGAVAGAEPTWPTTLGATVVDNAATWKAVYTQVQFSITMLAKTDLSIWEKVAFPTAVATADFDMYPPSVRVSTNGHKLREITFQLDISTFDIQPGDMVFMKMVRKIPTGTAATDAECPADIVIHQIILDF